MARIFDDTCGDLYTWETRLTYWDYAGLYAKGTIISEDGSTGNCLRIDPADFSLADTFIRKNLPASYDRLVLGFRFKTSRLPAAGYRTICVFWDNAANVQTSLSLSAAGALCLFRDGNYAQPGAFPIGTITNPDTIQPNTWAYIELDIAFALSDASFTLRVNSRPLLTGSSLQTANNANGVAMFSINCGTAYMDNGESHYFDDIYLNETEDDTQGHTGFDGDIQGLVFLPNASGQYTQQAIGGSAAASTNWQSVNQAISDNDVTFVSATSNGLKDTYKVPALPANVARVVSVTTVLDAKTDCSGLGEGAQIAPILGNGMTIHTGTAVSVNTSYIKKVAYWGSNPLTASAWSIGDWTNIEVGHVRVS